MYNVQLSVKMISVRMVEPVSGLVCATAQLVVVGLAHVATYVSTSWHANESQNGEYNIQAASFSNSSQLYTCLLFVTFSCMQ